MENTFSKSELFQKNLDPKYGGRWIHNLDKVSDKKELKLYATGYADVTGTKYIALPADLVLTDVIKRQYNLW
jgi:hypothetical protein